MHVYRFKLFFFFSSRRRHTRSLCDWSSDVCSSDLSGCLSYLASAERAFALLDEQPEVPERPNARPLQRAVGAVAFRGVSFAYGPDRPVLRDVSFEIEPGTQLGIVGATGAGKTTLISLLTRFYDAT